MDDLPLHQMRSGGYSPGLEPRISDDSLDDE
jgi:hypothetical protein